MRERTVIFSAAAFLMSLAVLSGCRSLPSSSRNDEVHPLALLSPDSSIYINVPVQNHMDLSAAILSAQIEGLTEKSARLLLSRVDNFYLGLGTVKDRSRLEAAALGNIPSVAVDAMLTKKNGWNKNPYTALSSEEAQVSGQPVEFDVYSRLGSDFRLSFPSESILCAAKNLDPLLENYALHAELGDQEYVPWITQESQDILFYITKPGQYLRNMIGTTVNGCDYVSGRMVYFPDSEKPSEYSGRYRLTINLHIANPKAMEAFNAMLKLSFGQLGASVRVLENLTIQISDIPVTQKQINDLFTRDPITGKHYKVVGDKIIEEKR